MRSVPLPISIGQRLALLRKRARLTQEELAERAGVSARTVRRIERGQRPHDWTCLQLAAALGLGVADERWLCDPGLAAAAPPPPVDALIGADAQVEAALALLADPRTTLLTVVGPGGVGKTALAREIASRLADDRERPVAFVPLAAVGDPRDVLPAIAAALHAPGDDAPLLRLQRALHGRRMLTVLDNLEHLPGAPPDLAALQRAAPGLAILATSREALRLPRERVLPLSPLPSDGPDAPAVHLFLRLAAQAGGAPGDDPETLATVQEVCRRLGGLPLAIELAAAQAGSLSPAHLLALLQRAGIAALPPSAATVDPRQASFAATFDWSWGLLDDAQRRMMRLLSVFAGGFDAGSAAALLAGADGISPAEAAPLAATAIADLAARHLVAQEPASPVDEEPRYLMLEPIRDLALGRLREVGEETSARRAHATAVSARLSGLDLHVIGTGRAGLAIDRIEREYANGIAALDWAIAARDAPLASEIARVLLHVWRYRDRWAEGSRRLEGLLAVADGLTPSGRSVIRFTLGDIAWRQGDLALLRSVAGALAADCAREPAPLGTLCETAGLLYLSTAAAEERDGPAALAFARQARAALPPDVDWTRPFVQGWADTRLGVELHRSGDLVAARALLAAALDRRRTEGNPRRLASTIGHLALVVDDLGEPRAAATLLREAAAAAIGFGDAWLTFHLGRWVLALAEARGGEPARRAAEPLRAALAQEQARSGYLLPPGRSLGPAMPDSGLTIPLALEMAPSLAALLPAEAAVRPGARFDDRILE